MVIAWKKSFSHISKTSSCIRSQFLWYNNLTNIRKTPCHFKEFSEKNVGYINQLFKDNGDLKHWKDFKREFYPNLTRTEGGPTWLAVSNILLS